MPEQQQPQKPVRTPVDINLLAASYLPPVPGFTHEMYAAPGRLNGTFANLHQMAVATFQDAMLRRAPRATPKDDSEKALLRNVWDAATDLLGKGWHNASVPDPLVDPVLMLSGAPDIAGWDENMEKACVYVECAFKPFERQPQGALAMLYPLICENTTAYSRASLRAGMVDAIGYRASGKHFGKALALIVSPDFFKFDPVQRMEVPALHAILHSALSIPGKRPNA